MRTISAIYARELRVYYTSPIAWVLLFMFAVLAGWFFSNTLAYYQLYSMQAAQSSMGEGVDLTQGVARPLFHNIGVILLFMLPLITMRLFAEEKKNGTLELLFTFPVRDLEAVLGKFAAAMTVLLSMLGVTLLYPALMEMVGEPQWGALLGGYLGLLLLGSAFLALGIWVSSLTENQIVAASGGFGALLLFFVLGWIETAAGSTAGKVVKHLSLVEHMDNFAKGVLDTSDILFFVNFTLFFLFLTLRALESRSWRG